MAEEKACVIVCAIELAQTPTEPDEMVMAGSGLTTIATEFLEALIQPVAGIIASA